MKQLIPGMIFLSLLLSPLHSIRGEELLHGGNSIAAYGGADLQEDKPTLWEESFHNYDPGPLVEISARSAVLLDYETGRVLFEKNPDLSIPPASMTKLVALHVLLGELERGNLRLDQEIIVPEGADFRIAPPRSSLMFLQEGQRLTLLDLMRGLALPSGNDGAELAARLLGGSRADYVERMNREMEELNLDTIHFVDTSGYSEENRATAADIARFCRFYIQRHPEAVDLLHNLESFSYPEDTHITGPGQALYGTITQPNNNALVGRHSWVDGLKTGYIDESGYNVALTAQAGGRRLIAVLMGGPGENSSDGNLHRVIDGTNLLAYGFYRFTNSKPLPPEKISLPLIGGTQEELELTVATPEELILFREEQATLHWELDLPPAVRAPLDAGETVGHARLMSHRRILLQVPIRVKYGVEKAAFLKRLLSALKRLFA